MEQDEERLDPIRGTPEYRGAGEEDVAGDTRPSARTAVAVRTVRSAEGVAGRSARTASWLAKMRTNAAPIAANSTAWRPARAPAWRRGSRARAASRAPGAWAGTGHARRAARHAARHEHHGPRSRPAACTRPRGAAKIRATHARFRRGLLLRGGEDGDAGRVEADGDRREQRPRRGPRPPRRAAARRARRVAARANEAAPGARRAFNPRS